jgi:hypothetical protein
MNCKADGCGSAAVVGGLCRKHYMRLRRTGSAEAVRAGGRPKVRKADDPLAVITRETFRDTYSPSTIERLILAQRICREIDAAKGEEQNTSYIALIKTYTRSNGTMNVSGILEHARLILALTQNPKLLDEVAE